MKKICGSKSLIVLLVLVMGIGIFVSGCTSEGENISGTISDEEHKRELELAYHVYSENLYDENGEILVELKITYPQISTTNPHEGIGNINEYYKSVHKDFIATVITDAKEIAEEDKKMALEYGYEFWPHRYEQWSEVYYNDNNLLSLLNTMYINTGGAHPNSYRYADNFQVDTGEKLHLNDVMGISLEESLARFYQVAQAEIERLEGTDNFMYFDDYQENISEYFVPEDFLLGEEGLLFFYQIYTLAPYAGGYPIFSIPYEEIGTEGLNITPVPVKDSKRELYYAATNLLESNKDIVYNIYGLSMLPLDMPDQLAEGEHIFPVAHQHFYSFDLLEGYIRSTYSQKQADELLENGRYLDIYGKLYGDIYMDGSMGYYANWDEYSYTLTEIREKSALLTINTQEDAPDALTEVSFVVNLEKVDGYWVMEKMTY